MKYELSPNPLIRFLKKKPGDFTKTDIILFVRANGIEMINLRYAAYDGRLKTLNFVINDIEHLDLLLSAGERVDGSSLFPFINAESSDLYVVPRFATAFVDPFAEIPTINLICSYFTREGLPLESAPDYVLRKAHKALKEVTGMDYEVMGELEYYVISDCEETFQTTDQKGYHESAPFNKGGAFRVEAMRMIAGSGGVIKYGHAEVGSFNLDGKLYEQNEIEFLPVPPEEAADQLLVAKYILRNLAYQYGVDITFAPKITAGKAGSGMHIHTRLMKEGKNMLIKNGELTEEAYKMIAGYLSLAPSITAFGNRIPASYLRLVPNQEAPTAIVWGDMNRAALVRVPLGWTKNASDMSAIANGLVTGSSEDYSGKQTIEFRASDGSADVYLLLAALAVAVRYGFEMKDGVDYAKKLYVAPGQKNRMAEAGQLPDSCEASVRQLERQRGIYEERGVFSSDLIDGMIDVLRSYKDSDLRERLKADPSKTSELVKDFFHCG